MGKIRNRCMQIGNALYPESLYIGLKKTTTIWK